MEKEFIHYEQALDLKELGFDEPCFAWFLLEGEKSTLVLEKCPKQDIGLCLTPLYQQAFRWFREKYQIYSWVSKFEWFVFYIYSETLPKPTLFTLEKHQTYEEAELACLKKLIEIIKNNK